MGKVISASSYQQISRVGYSLEHRTTTNSDQAQCCVNIKTRIVFLVDIHLIQLANSLSTVEDALLSPLCEMEGSNQLCSFFLARPGTPFPKMGWMNWGAGENDLETVL